MKSGFVAIIGKPNAGKSTLLNKILNSKISIISDKAQTTRNSILGIYNKEDLQIVFVDTPGIHNPKNGLGSYMNKVAYNEANGCDVIYYLVDTNIGITKDDKDILNTLFSYNIPVFLLLNKVDEVKKTILLERLTYASNNYDFKEYMPLSALDGTNIDTLLDITVKYLKDGPKYYDNDVLTNVSVKYQACELIRERVLRNIDKEIPHLVAVNIDTFTDSDNRVIIEASIIVNKESHKGIIIGKNGNMLSKINAESTTLLKELFHKKVVLSLFVKVDEDWINNSKKLFELGYFIDK